MEENNMKGVSLMIVMFLRVTSAIFQGCCEDSNKTMAAANNGFGSSVVFPITGNVYPLGYYSVILKIGNPPKPFDLDIDTGSDLTWVQCHAPCVRCTQPIDKQDKPKHNFVSCSDPLCQAIQSRENKPCSQDPQDQCDYEVDYADKG